MVEPPTQILEWMDNGFEFFHDQLDKLADDDFDRPSTLPDWSRKTVVAHVGLNARALGRLVNWAATIVPTPMYDSASARESEIREASSWDIPQLRRLVAAEQAALSSGLASLDSDAWSRAVTTAQGRSVAASEIPWLRARELWIHAIDLEAGAAFEDLPEALLDRLVTEAVARHRTRGVPQLKIAVAEPEGNAGPSTIESGGTVVGPLAALARWLTRRQPDGVRSADGAPLPELEPWL
jgi:maleylpyruvate isomerase